MLNNYVSLLNPHPAIKTTDQTLPSRLFFFFQAEALRRWQQKKHYKSFSCISCRVSVSQIYILINLLFIPVFLFFIIYIQLLKVWLLSKLSWILRTESYSLKPNPSSTSVRLKHSLSLQLPGFLLGVVRSSRKLINWNIQQNLGWNGSLEVTLVQSPVQCEANFKVKPCCSGPCPDEFLKSPKMQIPQPLSSHLNLSLYYLIPPTHRHISKKAVEFIH